MPMLKANQQSKSRKHFRTWQASSNRGSQGSRRGEVWNESPRRSRSCPGSLDRLSPRRPRWRPSGVSAPTRIARHPDLDVHARQEQSNQIKALRTRLRKAPIPSGSNSRRRTRVAAQFRAANRARRSTPPSRPTRRKPPRWSMRKRKRLRKWKTLNTHATRERCRHGHRVPHVPRHLPEREVEHHSGRKDLLGPGVYFLCAW